MSVVGKVLGTDLLKGQIPSRSQKQLSPDGLTTGKKKAIASVRPKHQSQEMSQSDRGIRTCQIKRSSQDTDYTKGQKKHFKGRNGTGILHASCAPSERRDRFLTSAPGDTVDQPVCPSLVVSSARGLSRKLECDHCVREALQAFAGQSNVFCISAGRNDRIG
ncbi:hypothetical protein H920_20337 [Fukomys damarensis]|uniref:Uncharacterized protein n=1 Tax=Fukomys damarensis TaxID=885580 RepID=A0A091CIK5_FUKDA|nr:hypothetical protein H920_20337 [Fukomys damarensis]